MLFILGASYIRNPTPVVSAAHVAKFFTNVIKRMAEVARIGHVWIASLIGAFQFGVMLAAGVVWAPKLLVVHGFSPSTADFGPRCCGWALPWSDVIQHRKLPMLAGGVVHLRWLWPSA